MVARMGVRPDNALEEAAARVAALRTALAARGPVRLVETHLSWVLVDARPAYKL